MRGGVYCHRHWVGIGVMAKALACGPVTATPRTSLTLLKASLFPPMPFSSMSFPDENLDRVGRTTTASFATLPPWCCLGCSCPWWSIALLGEDPLLRLPSLSFLYIVQVVLVVVWRMLCRCAARADALPPSSLVEFSWGGCFAAAVGWSSGCFATLFVLLTFATLPV